MQIVKITFKIFTLLLHTIIHIPNLHTANYKEYFLLKTNNIIVLCHQNSQIYFTTSFLDLLNAYFDTQVIS